MKTALVFGASGQIGAPLLDHLRDAGWRVIAVSRGQFSDQPCVQWLRGDFSCLPALPARTDAVISCGPLDHFSHWYAHTFLHCERMIAFGSTSVEVKQDSHDPEERALAARLREAEDRLRWACAQADTALTLLRPTLIYGAGGDRTLTRIAAIARRYHRFVLPKSAEGLRQPVHAQDLAQATFDALNTPATYGKTYALPGGETLPYHAMVERVLHTLEPPVPLYRVPNALFWLLLAAAQSTGRLNGLTSAIVQRMERDVTFDATPAARDFGYAPRPFQPTIRAFGDGKAD